jgi:YegS/Rv2252/BmrU family lipid kinase
MRPLVIVNPVAGYGRPAVDMAPIEAAFASLDAEIHATEHAGDAEASAYDAVASGRADIVVAGGGDGTLNEVVNGVLRARDGGAALAGIGVLPLGSQNVLAAELGIPSGDPAGVAALITAGKTLPVDVGKVGDRYFTLMAGFGFDAAVVHGVVPMVKGLMGPVAYAFATLGELARYKSTRMMLTLDDERIDTDAFVVVVANASSYAFRDIKVAPFASITDGWLDVCAFERPPSDRIGFATQLMLLLARRHLKDPRVRYFRAKRIQIESDPPVQSQLDGEMGAYTPLEITIVPNGVPIFVP